MIGRVLKTGCFLRKQISFQTLPDGFVTFVGKDFMEILFLVEISASEGLSYQNRVLRWGLVGTVSKRVHFIFGICSVIIRCIRPQKVDHNLWVRWKCSRLPGGGLSGLGLMY